MIDLDMRGLEELKKSHLRSGYKWDDAMQMSEHRACAVRLLGRMLTREEHVHHINEKKSDNHPENLIVLNVGVHDLIHASFASYHFTERWGDMHDVEALIAFLKETGLPYFWLGDYNHGSSMGADSVCDGGTGGH